MVNSIVYQYVLDGVLKNMVIIYLIPVYEPFQEKYRQNFI